ncbi:MAG: MFS transporter, partial [Acidobacteriota bacterium]
ASWDGVPPWYETRSKAWKFFTGAGADLAAKAHSNREDKKPGSLRSLAEAMQSWRTASVALLSFSSGLPLGLVWIAIPDWMRNVGVDIRIVGLFTLAQVPWSFKVLWSPLMDRFVPPWLGRRRGWAAIAQTILSVLTLMLAGVGHHPDTPWVVMALALAIAFASASQDIAIDAYAVDVLRPEEQGVAVGARVAIYRAAMFVAGGLAITLAGRYSWPLVNVALALCYLPMLLVTWRAPEPEKKFPSPRSLGKAVWHPFLGFLSRHRAIEILAFVVFYKFADNLAQSLTRPFLIDMGYSDFDRGVALATVGLLGTLLGTFFGGAVTTVIGLGHSLWVFGFLQIFSNLGYVLVAGSEVNRALMYGATGFEQLTSGMGTGAFSVLLLRMTQKRFSATQYALFSSLFGLPRIVAGPITGFVVDAVGWRTYFWITMVCGIPGMLLLGRFVPLGAREPSFAVEPTQRRDRLSRTQLGARGLIGGALGTGLAASLLIILAGLKAMREPAGASFDVVSGLSALLHPTGIGDWIQLAGTAVFGTACGLFTAAVFAARHGAGGELAADEGDGKEAVSG